MITHKIVIKNLWNEALQKLSRANKGGGSDINMLYTNNVNIYECISTSNQGLTYGLSEEHSVNTLKYP